MKIAVFHNLPSGGALRALYDKIKLFESAGHQVSLYVFSSAEKSFLPAPQISGSLFEVPLNFSGPLKWMRYMAASKISAKQINDSDADIVYVDKCRFMGSPTVLRFLKKATLLYLHEPLGIREYTAKAMSTGNVFADLSKSYLKLSLRAKLTKLLSIPERVWVKKNDRLNVFSAGVVLTCSHYARAWISRVYSVTARVAYQGVDMDFFKPDETVKKIRQLLSVGRIEPRKGFDFLVDVVSAMRLDIRPQLVIVCDEAESSAVEKLKSKADRLNVDLEIICRPVQERLRRLYQESLIVLCSGVNEPFGLVPLEAAACGTAVIAVNEGGYQETVAEGVTGWLLPRNATSWADKIAALINHPLELNRVGKLASAFVSRKWTWKMFLDTVEQQMNPN